MTKCKVQQRECCTILPNSADNDRFTSRVAHFSYISLYSSQMLILHSTDLRLNKRLSDFSFSSPAPKAPGELIGYAGYDASVFPSFDNFKLHL